MMKNRVSVGILLLFVLTANVPAALADGGHSSPDSRPDIREGQAATRTETLPEGLQQAAAGELAIVSATAEPSLDLASVTFKNLCVKNYRSTAANDVWVEGWVSDQVPQMGGNLTHLTVAQYNVGLVQALSTRCVSSGTVQLTPPNPGQYWKSIALYEGSGEGRTLQFVYTESEKWDAGGPFSGTNIFFETPATHFITDGGNTASLQVRRIGNSSYSGTRQLMIGLRASSEIPRYGYNLGGYTIASKEYPALPANSSVWNVDTGSMSVTQPPPGTYWITAVLWQKSTDGYYLYNCIYTFPTKYTFSGAVSAPAADFSFSPASPQVGQTVTFTDASTGNPTSWSWNFGDGGVSTTRSPSHVFSTSGTFSVALTAANSGGSNSRTKTVIVTAVATAPVISYFTANPTSISPGQQTTLSWSSTGGTSASIDQGIGTVPTSGSIAINPVVGVPYHLTVTGPGGSSNATVTISAAASTYAATWILPSSARVSGQNAFWMTDLVVMNPGTSTASVNIKFLGHEGNGSTGQERTYTIGPKATATWADVLSLMFSRESDYGPILIRSNATSIVAQGQTWTASPTGGSYGQSVPAISAAESVGASARTLSGIRQDSAFRTNIVLANMKESDASVTLQVLLPDGTTATVYTTTVGPFGFVQLNLANHLGITNLVGGSVVVSSATAGAQIAAYASVIDSATADPRTILAR